jgi:hypothetical protein
MGRCFSIFCKIGDELMFILGLKDAAILYQ